MGHSSSRTVATAPSASSVLPLSPAEEACAAAVASSSLNNGGCSSSSLPALPELAIAVRGLAEPAPPLPTIAPPRRRAAASPPRDAVTLWLALIRAAHKSSADSALAARFAFTLYASPRSEEGVLSRDGASSLLLLLHPRDFGQSAALAWAWRAAGAEPAGVLLAGGGDVRGCSPWRLDAAAERLFAAAAAAAPPGTPQGAPVSAFLEWANGRPLPAIARRFVAHAAASSPSLQRNLIARALEDHRAFATREPRVTLMRSLPRAWWRAWASSVRWGVAEGAASSSGDSSVQSAHAAAPAAAPAAPAFAAAAKGGDAVDAPFGSLTSGEETPRPAADGASSTTAAAGQEAPGVLNFTEVALEEPPALFEEWAALSALASTDTAPIAAIPARAAASRPGSARPRFSLFGGSSSGSSGGSSDATTAAGATTAAAVAAPAAALSCPLPLLDPSAAAVSVPDEVAALLSTWFPSVGLAVPCVAVCGRSPLPGALPIPASAPCGQWHADTQPLRIWALALSRSHASSPGAHDALVRALMNADDKEIPDVSSCPGRNARRLSQLLIPRWGFSLRSLLSAVLHNVVDDATHAQAAPDGPVGGLPTPHLASGSVYVRTRLPGGRSFALWRLWDGASWGALEERLGGEVWLDRPAADVLEEAAAAAAAAAGAEHGSDSDGLDDERDSVVSDEDVEGRERGGTPPASAAASTYTLIAVSGSLPRLSNATHPSLWLNTLAPGDELDAFETRAGVWRAARVMEVEPHARADASDAPRVRVTFAGGRDVAEEASAHVLPGVGRDEDGSTWVDVKGLAPRWTRSLRATLVVGEAQAAAPATAELPPATPAALRRTDCAATPAAAPALLLLTPSPMRTAALILPLQNAEVTAGSSMSSSPDRARPSRTLPRSSTRLRVLQQHLSHLLLASPSSSMVVSAPSKPSLPGAISSGLLVGLRNLGNSCYLAASLQALTALPELSSFFSSSGQWSQELCPNNPLGHGGELARTLASLLTNAAITAPKQRMPRTLHQLACTASRAHPGNSLALPQRLPWSPQGALAPSSLKGVLARANRDVFGDKLQQDAHEALAFILDGLHEDVNLVPPAHKAYVPAMEVDAVKALRAAAAASLAEGGALSHLGSRLQVHSIQDSGAVDTFAGDAAQAAESWRLHSLRNRSRVQSLAWGQLCSRITCGVCAESSTSFDAFSFLQLELPHGVAAARYEAAAAEHAAASAAAAPGPIVRLLITFAPRHASSDAHHSCASSSSDAHATTAATPPRLPVPVEFILPIAADATVEDAQTVIASAVGAAVGDIVIATLGSSNATDVRSGGLPRLRSPIRRVLARQELLSTAISATDTLAAFELPAGATTASAATPASRLCVVTQMRPSSSSPGSLLPVGFPAVIAFTHREGPYVLPELWLAFSQQFAHVWHAFAVAAFAALRPSLERLLSSTARGQGPTTARLLLSRLDVIARLPEFVASAVHDATKTAPSATGASEEGALRGHSRRGQWAVRLLTEGTLLQLRVVRPARGRGSAAQEVEDARGAGACAGMCCSGGSALCEGCMLPFEETAAGGRNILDAIKPGYLLVAAWAEGNLGDLCASLMDDASAAAAAEAKKECAGSGAGAHPVAEEVEALIDGTSPALGVPLWVIATGHVPPLVMTRGAALTTLEVLRPLAPPSSVAELEFLATASWSAVADSRPGVTSTGARPLHHAAAMLAGLNAHPLAPAAAVASASGDDDAASQRPPSLARTHSVRALSGVTESGEAGAPPSLPFSRPSWVPLISLLSAFTAPETLSLTEGDGWSCPTCKVKVSAEKRLSLWSLPPLLFVQLKRFAFDKGDGEEAGSKVTLPVDAPLVLDLSAWACTQGPPTAHLPSITPAHGAVAHLRPSSVLKGGGAAAAPSPLDAALGQGSSGISAATVATSPLGGTPPPSLAAAVEPQLLLYDLVSLVNHVGETQHCGHYTAAHRHDTPCLVAGGECHKKHVAWLLADDTRLSLVAVGSGDDILDPPAVLPAVVTADAYMLVYRRRAGA